CGLVGLSVLSCASMSCSQFALRWIPLGAGGGPCPRERFRSRQLSDVLRHYVRSIMRGPLSGGKPSAQAALALVFLCACSLTTDLDDLHHLSTRSTVQTAASTGPETGESGGSPSSTASSGGPGGVSDSGAGGAGAGGSTGGADSPLGNGVVCGDG